MKADIRKKALVLLGALVVLAASYLVCRYALFDLHGMKQWPTVLFVAALAVLLLSGVTGKPRLACCTSLGYICGFALGLLLRTTTVDPAGGSVDNMWRIWTVALVAFMLLGAALEFIATVRRVRSAPAASDDEDEADAE